MAVLSHSLDDPQMAQMDADGRRMVRNKICAYRIVQVIQDCYMSQPVASDQANPIVEVENLNMFYGETQALYDIDLSIPEREVTAFIGPSGCGKSTLLRCFIRLNDLIESARIEGSMCGSVAATFTRPIAM